MKIKMECPRKKTSQHDARNDPITDRDRVPCLNFVFTMVALKGTITIPESPSVGFEGYWPVAIGTFLVFHMICIKS